MSPTDNYGVKARIADFDKRNGGNPVCHNGWFLYANGARRDAEPLGALLEPPEDEHQQLSISLQYHQARHAVAVREFDNLKEELATSGCPQPEGLDELRRLREIVGECNQAVTEVEARLDGTEIGSQQAANRRLVAEQKQEMADYRNSLKHIRI